MNTDTKPTIVGLGEALFDIFPKSESLGGAPLNVAFHAHQLGNHGVVASRIGDDELGRRVTRHLRARKMRADYLQIDTDRDTGTVNIILRDGEPSYEIVERVAWDEMHFDRRFAKLAENCDAVCFGTLAQRRSTSRQTVQRFVEKAELAVRLFDVNLRQDFFTGPTIEKSLKLANAAKLNTEELRIVGQLLELSGETPIHQVQQLREQFELEFVALTRGAEGVLVCLDDEIVEAPPVQADTGSGDRVGAGDSAAAAILHGRLRSWPWLRTIQLANTLGALVASCSGACPPLNETVKQLLDE